MVKEIHKWLDEIKEKWMAIYEKTKVFKQREVPNDKNTDEIEIKESYEQITLEQKDEGTKTIRTADTKQDEIEQLKKSITERKIPVIDNKLSKKDN